MTGLWTWLSGIAAKGQIQPSIAVAKAPVDGDGSRRTGELRLRHSAAAPGCLQNFRCWSLIDRAVPVPVLLSLTQTGSPPGDAERSGRCGHPAEDACPKEVGFSVVMVSVESNLPPQRRIAIHRPG